MHRTRTRHRRLESIEDHRETQETMGMHAYICIIGDQVSTESIGDHVGQAYRRHKRPGRHIGD